MSNLVRWGLVSTANINRRLIPAIRMSERGELTAVASRSADRAAAYATEWEIPQLFGSYQEMFQSGAIDAVYISTPNHRHADLTVAALEAGIHVLCEKPFALTLDEVDTMTRTAAETGRVLAEAFMYRHHPQTKILGEWVQSGKLGRIHLMRATFNFTLNNAENVRLNPEWGGGSLWDVGIYPISLAQYVMGGPPQTVFGRQWVSGRGVDEYFAGQMDYGDDRFAQISCSFCTPWHTEAEIVGSDGRLTLTRPFVGLDQKEQALTFHPRDGEPQTIAVPEKYLYLGEVEDMHDAILDGADNYLTLAETRNHVRTALALYRSAATGAPVSL